jgi:hypothetical protein
MTALSASSSGPSRMTGTLAGAPGALEAPTAVGYSSTNSLALFSRSMTTPSYGSPSSSSASHARCANGQMGAYQNVSGAAGGIVDTRRLRSKRSGDGLFSRTCVCCVCTGSRAARSRWHKSKASEQAQRVLLTCGNARVASEQQEAVWLAVCNIFTGARTACGCGVPCSGVCHTKGGCAT